MKSLTRLSNSKITENHLWTISLPVPQSLKVAFTFVCQLPSNLQELPTLLISVLYKVNVMSQTSTTYAIIVGINSRMLGPPSWTHLLYLIVDLPIWLHSDQSLREREGGRWSSKHGLKWKRFWGQLIPESFYSFPVLLPIQKVLSLIHKIISTILLCFSQYKSVVSDFALPDILKDFWKRVLKFLWPC